MNWWKWAALPVAGLALMGCFGLAKWTVMMSSQPEAALSTGDAARGEEIFRHGVNESPPCIGCHQVSNGGFGFALGPNLSGIATRAGKRVTGMSAEAYLEDSILHPSDFVVPGYRDIMYPQFADHFSDQDVADLVAYLMTR
jgi:mono/diheme cytochrome c family protein